MKHHIEEEGVSPDSKKGLEKDEVAGAADGQKFGQALNDPEKDSFRYANLSPPIYGM